MSDPAPIERPAPTGSCVYTVRKKCYLCGQEWDGKSFVPQPPGVAPVPGVCQACLDKDAAEMARLLAQGPVTESGKPLPVLTRPPRPPDDGDDEPEDRHLRIAP